MDLPLSLRALFGGLAADLEDPEVREILISGPGRIFVVRGQVREHSVDSLSDPRIRSLAARLLEKRTLSPDHVVQVVGTPRGPSCPIIQITRRVVPDLTLARMHERGGIDQSSSSVLQSTAHNACGVVITGARGAGKTAMLAALAREWSHKRKLAVLDKSDGVLANAAIGHCVIEPSGGVKDAVAIGVDAIVVDAPDAALWRELLVLGRPFIATIEAPDAQTALGRILARVLAADANASRTAAEAIVESSVDLVLELLREKDTPRLRAISEPTRERGTLIARPVLAERRTTSFVAIEAPRANTSALGAAQVSPLGHSAVPTSPPTPARATRMPRRKSSMPLDELARRNDPTPAIGTQLPNLSPSPPPDAAKTDPLPSSPPPLVAPPLPSLPQSARTAPQLLSSNAPLSTGPSSPPARTAPLLSSNAPPSTGLRPSSPPPARTGPPLPNFPPPARTEPYSTVDLEVPVAVPAEASPPIDASGDHGFDLSELSEIRADHLVSKSFIYNIQSLDIPEEEPSQDIVLADVPPDIRATFDATEENLDKPARTNGMFGGSLAEQESLAELAGHLGIDHESDDINLPISAENMVSPSMLSQLDDDSDLGEIQRARRQAQERTPTVLNNPPGADPHDATIQPDEWAAAELNRRSSSKVDATAPENSSVDLMTTSHSDIHAADLMSSAPSPTEENALASSDLDSTQSAMVSEMVSSFPDPNAFDPDEDLGAFRTINPEANGEDVFPKTANGALAIDQDTGGLVTNDEDEADLDSVSSKHGFEEVTPYWPLLSKDKPPEISVNGSIDPGRAAVVSDKEFDAMIDELRDVTASSNFSEEEEMTENGGDARDLPGKRTRVIQDGKRQRRLR